MAVDPGCYPYPRGQLAMTSVHIIGAGLAGLSAALFLQEQGLRPRLYDANSRPGGRCGGWSPAPGAPRRDRGTHLLLSGNDTVCGLIRRYGRAEDWIRLPPRFRFRDLAEGTDWNLHPGAGRWPGWLLNPTRRVAGLGVFGHLHALLPLETSRAETVGAALDLRSVAGRRLIGPLTVALLNTPAEIASLPLLRRTLRDSLYRGGQALSPLLCRTSLEKDLITPLTEALSAAGVEIRLRSAVSELQQTPEGLRLSGPAGPVFCGRDPVILAVDPAQAHRLLPDLLPDLPQSPILNLHYPIPDRGPEVLAELTGLCGGAAEWILRRSGHCAVTISAPRADLLADPDLPGTVWREIRQVYPDLPLGCPADARLLTERRATLLQTPDTDRLRPQTRPTVSGWPETLWLAGDWVQTGLPCTLEGAARSGRMAALAVIGHLRP